MAHMPSKMGRCPTWRPFKKYQMAPSTLLSDAQAFPVRCHALHCCRKSRTPRSRIRNEVASAAVRTGRSLSSADWARHAEAKALNACGPDHEALRCRAAPNELKGAEVAQGFLTRTSSWARSAWRESPGAEDGRAGHAASLVGGAASPRTAHRTGTAVWDRQVHSPHLSTNHPPNGNSRAGQAPQACPPRAAATPGARLQSPKRTWPTAPPLTSRSRPEVCEANP